MKKHLFSLMIAFVLVMGVNVSAFAQTVISAITAAEGSPGNPKIYLSGASSTITINKGYAASTVDWDLYSGTDATGSLASATATPATEDADLDISATPVDKTAWTPHQDDDAASVVLSTFRFKWTDNAAGNYYLQVTETADDAHGGCSTIRGFHIFIMGFDVEVYASLEDGTRIIVADDLTNCGDGAQYPAFLNNVALNPAGDAIRGDVLNSSNTPIGTSGDLTGVHGTGPLTTRYYTAEIFYDAPPTGSTFTPQDNVESATMDIEIQGGITPVDVYSINNVDIHVDEEDNNVATTTVNGTTKFTFAVQFYNRWQTDLTPQAEVLNVKLYSDADAGGANLGEEPVAYEDVTLSDEATETPSYKNNLSNAFTIYGRPGTSVITAH